MLYGRFCYIRGVGFTDIIFDGIFWRFQGVHESFEVSDIQILFFDSIFWRFEGICEFCKEFSTTTDNESVDCSILFATILSVVPHLHSQLFVLPPIMLVNVAVGW